MKKIFRHSAGDLSMKIKITVGLCILLFSFGLQIAGAATMNDYCVTPPYIGAAIEPNLLLFIDNSASMYDPMYTDKKQYCANNTAQICTSDSVCQGLSPALYPAYCKASTQKIACAADATCALKTAGDTCGNDGFCVQSTLPVQCTQDSTCGAITSGDTCNNRCGVSHTCFDDAYNNSKVCSVTSTINCTSDANCPSGETCVDQYPGLYDQNAFYINYDAYYYYLYGGYIPSGVPWANMFYNYTYIYTTTDSSGKTSTTSASYWPTTADMTADVGCTYGGPDTKFPYLCVHLDLNGRVDKFIASGKFLNWLTMSKLDIEKQILTGGKNDLQYNTTYGLPLLSGETRGCSGRKYIKTVPGLLSNNGDGTSITFAIRGGSTTGVDKITSQATEYGQTYIEIYKGTYNAAACTAAMNDWMNVNSTNLGTLQGDTGCCLAGGTSTNGCSPKDAKLIVFNQNAHDCYWYYTGHGLSNEQPVQNACQNDWATYNSTNCTSYDPGNVAACITNPDAGDAICSSVLTHPQLPNGNTTGYLGLCYNFSTKKWNDNCSVIQNEDFCAGLSGAPSPVTDPPSDQQLSGTLQNVPGFVMEAGLDSMTMVNDYSSVGGTKGFKSEIYFYNYNYNYNASTGIWIYNYTWPLNVTGLIDKYKNMIRFGGMTFQNNGSASECNQSGHCSISLGTTCVADSACPSSEKCVFPIACSKVCSNDQHRQCYEDKDCSSGGTCVPLTKTDGGKIISYVGSGNCSVTTATACTVDSDCPLNETCIASVGDHTSGFIKSIDNIVASSWTPFAEAFYNAMGYYARSNDYTQGVAPTSRTEFNFSGWPAAYATNKNPSQRSCQKNVVLIVTDGMSTADSNAQVDGSGGLVKAYAPLVTDVINGVTYTGVYGYDTTNKCPTYDGSRSLPVLTWVANHRNIKNLSLTDPTLKHCANNIFGPACTQDSECAPGDICTNQPIHSSESMQTYVVYNGKQTSAEPGLCDPKTLMTAAAMNGGTQLFQAASASQLSTALANAFDQVAAKASSGTAASVLASGEGSGANLIQAVFYPHKRFSWCSNAVGTTCTQDSDCGSGNTCVNNVEVSWIGRLTNLWYYVDPFAHTSSIREDNGTTGSAWPAGKTPGNGDKIMDLATTASSPSDYIVQMYYDKSAGVTKVNRWLDPAGNGVIGSAMPTINFEDIGNLWEAGAMLWKRNLGTTPRNIKTTTDGVNLINFSTANAPTLASYLNTTDASNLISWVTGSDVAGYRSRAVMMPNTDNIARVWKLGDIVNSTPKLLSWMALNNYYVKYGDTTYGHAGSLGDPADSSHFVTTAAYKKRGMVFAGGNDGMLHAFKLGTLQLSWSGQGATQKARLVNPDTGTVCKSTDATPCGQEVWAFIPKNALPYLKYMADQAYCHVNSIDLTPFIFDASIGGLGANDQKTAASWRTVLIGGMRFGGACKDFSDASCTTPNCVKTPIAGVGYSSYFALDITDSDPTKWKLLWEFSDPRLGFASTGPAIIRANGDGTTLHIADKDTNGNWFVVIGSGPTGPISTTDHQFLGGSDQSLKIFILDLRTGKLLNDGAPNFDTGIPNAFAGSLEGGAQDLNYDYQDDLIYIPYVKKASDGTWTDGGVLRLVTKNDPTPANWTWSTLIDNIGPVTASVAKIFDMTAMNQWVYFGTGRYYYVQNTSSDDPKGQRRLFGIKDPCMKGTGYDFSCTTARNFSDLSDVTDIKDAQALTSSGTANGSGFFGWYISLDPDGLYTYLPDPETNFMAERDIANPLATSSGVVYFTTYKPYTDLCLLGGKSFIWTLQYNTGDFPHVTGLALVQTSTGAIEQLPITDRKSTALEGLPSGSPTMQKPPAAANRFIHVRER
jgi:type IV pilus assembly protein PilY1